MGLPINFKAGAKSQNVKDIFFLHGHGLPYYILEDDTVLAPIMLKQTPCYMNRAQFYDPEFYFFLGAPERDWYIDQVWTAIDKYLKDRVAG